ncbi:unnamed protein product [Porites evermanni]|uniref:Protein kinase domain-containing protein n=1 Tax=Porites evermanni TaxID=104178 RepID=A0ABN8MHB4_9CNID|nr:unnamed protein product [Porites evermanni]
MGAYHFRKKWKWMVSLGTDFPLLVATESCEIIRTPQFSTTARKFKVCTKDPSDLVVLPLSIDPFEKRKKAPSDNKKKANQEGRALHHLPKMRNALSSSDKWSEMKKRGSQYPGFSQSSNDIAYCKNIKEMKGFGPHLRLHFMWNDNQLSKRHTTTRKCQIGIEGKNTEITLRRAPCEAQTRYAWPTNDDGRRWMGIVSDADLEHNHSKPAPHRFSQEDLPSFEWANLNDKEEIGRGSFGSGFLAKYTQTSKDDGRGDLVVIKKLLRTEEEDKRLFLKEAKTLQG